MQVTKTYSGSVSLGSKVSRLVSYGVTATSSVYSSRVDIVNSKIAEFLRTECNVDAYYDTYNGSSDKFLLIYGVPFLFNVSSTNAYAAFYGPLYGTALNSGSNTSTSATFSSGHSVLFDGSTGTYSFSLIFSGNPNNCFALRFKTFESDKVSNFFVIRFMKCVNLINGLTSVVWSARNMYSNGGTSTTSPLLGGMNGIDLNAGGTINPSSFSNTLMSYDSILRTKPVHKDSNLGALPLVPLCIGPYRVNGVYLRPVGFGLPDAAKSSVEIQHEVTISGRSFLITNSDSVNYDYINLGLIETT